MNYFKKIYIFSKYLVHLVKQICMARFSGPFKFVVFSKDRPMQLHALLKSMQHYIKGEFEIYIIYSTSNEEPYQKAYLDLEQEFINDNIQFVKEEFSFQKTLKNVIERFEKSRIFFLVDDIVFKNHIDLSILKEFDTKNTIFSLRHGTHLSYSYVVDKDQKLPKISKSSFSPELITWKWSCGEYDWGYPFSVDGHLFEISEVKFWVNNLEFKSPNTFELALQLLNRFNFYKSGLAFKNSIIVNIPCNKVQNEIQNYHGNYHQMDLLNLWNEGYRIDFLSFHNVLNKSVHEEFEFKLIK